MEETNKSDYNLNELYNEISNINKVEIKPTETKFLKFNEEFGEFVSEYIKLKGYSYKEFNKEAIIEEMADTLQCLLSIYADIEKETGITLKDILLTIHIKNKKWLEKISQYKKLNDKNL